MHSPPWSKGGCLLKFGLYRLLLPHGWRVLALAKASDKNQKEASGRQVERVCPGKGREHKPLTWAACGWWETERESSAAVVAETAEHTE